MLAGFYYYGSRNIGIQAGSDCKIDYERINCKIDYERIKQIVHDEVSGISMNNPSSNNLFTGGCRLKFGSANANMTQSGLCTLAGGPRVNDDNYFWQCYISTTEIWGKGCQVLKENSKALDLGQPQDDAHGGSHYVKNECSEIAEDGYTCVMTQSLMPWGYLCSCMKK